MMQGLRSSLFSQSQTKNGPANMENCLPLCSLSLWKEVNLILRFWFAYVVHYLLRNKECSFCKTLGIPVKKYIVLQPKKPTWRLFVFMFFPLTLERKICCAWVLGSVLCDYLNLVIFGGDNFIFCFLKLYLFLLLCKPN